MTGQALAARIAALMPRAEADLADLVACACRPAAEWVAAAFTEAGLWDVHLDETPDGSYAVLGHRPPPARGAPTVLLHCRYDRAAEGIDNVIVHLTALRALGDDLPLGVKLLADAAHGGLARYVPAHAADLRADTILADDRPASAVLAGTFPRARILLLGATGLGTGLERLALAEALFLRTYG